MILSSRMKAALSRPYNSAYLIRRRGGRTAGRGMKEGGREEGQLWGRERMADGGAQGAST